MKSKLLLTVLLFVVCEGSIHAQGTFQKVYGGAGIDDAYYVQQTTDGGFILTGVTTSLGELNGDIFLLKTNATGDTVFTKSYGGNQSETGYNVHQTSDGGYIISASTNSFGAGLYDVYLVKTNATGDTLWTRTYGGPDEDYGYGVQQTSDGGYIVTGIKKKISMQDNDVYLVKTDANGDTLWTKTYGANNHDEGYAVQQTTDGGYIVVGLKWFGAGSADVYLIKTNASGDTLWTKTYGGADVDYGYDVRQTTDGGYIIVAHTQMLGAGSWDVLLIKTNGNGSMVWSKTYGGAGVDLAYSVQETTDGGYLFAGSTNNSGGGDYDMYLVKTNIAGDTTWTRTYGGTGEDRGYYAVQTSDGGYIIAGYTVTFGVGSVNLYLVKTDANGNTECNQYNTTTMVTVPPTLASNSPATVANPSVAVGHSVAAIHSGATVTLLCSGSGTNEITGENNSMNIFPNPAIDQLTVQVEGTAKINHLLIQNTLGQAVFEKNLSAAGDLDEEIDVSNLTQGIYLITVATDHDKLSKVFVKN